MSTDSPNSGSRGLLPAMSSNSTTPSRLEVARGRWRGVGIKVGLRVGGSVRVEGDGGNRQRQRWRVVGVAFRWKRDTTLRRGERESRKDIARGRRRSVGLGVGGGDGSNQRRRRGSTFLLQQPRLRAFRCVGVLLGGQHSPTVRGARRGLLLLRFSSTRCICDPGNAGTNDGAKRASTGVGAAVMWFVGDGRGTAA